MYERYFKRFLDVVLSSAALIFLAPILLVIAVLVRIKLGSPVLFEQQRPGKNEKIFNMYKFRSMTDEKDKNGKLLPDEERLTNFGRSLRETSLDELPSLWNVFKGDMSLIGPRPLLVRYLPYYTFYERKRHSVRPGLTGWAQVNGRNHLDWESRLAYDVEYVESISFFFDCKIILNTIFKVLKKSDIASGDEMILRSLDVERKNKNI